MNYGHDRPRIIQYGSTQLINGFERYVLDLPGYDKYGHRLSYYEQKELEQKQAEEAQAGL